MKDSISAKHERIRLEESMGRELIHNFCENEDATSRYASEFHNKYHENNIIKISYYMRK
jgi:hypothetical protein